MDAGLEEAVATLLWAAPRLQMDVQELKEVHKIKIVIRSTRACTHYSPSKECYNFLLACLSAEY